MQSAIKAILWDNDGVLVDTEKLYYQANLEILSKINLELNPESYRTNFLVNGYGMFRILGPLGYSSAEIEIIRQERNDIYSALLRANNNSMPGALEVLEELSGKYRMGIVTGSRRDHFDIIHANTSMLDYFEFVVTQGDYLNSKPSPDPYLEGVKRLDLDIGECIAIEDTERGLMSAKSAGLTCVVIPNQQSQASDFSKADRILNSISQVPQILAKINKLAQ